MAREYPSVLDLVGSTPIVRLDRISRDVPGTILAKLEFLNPGGSVKDRIGMAMIEAAERDGRLRPGGTIVEPTSGNTGVGLAIAAALKGYRCIFVMPDKMSQEKIAILRAYGAEVVITPTAVDPDSPESYYSVSSRLAEEIPGGFKPDQYSNMANPEAHYRSTGPEIFEQTGGELDAIVISVGTGGTISGVGRYFKERKPGVLIVGADPEGGRVRLPRVRSGEVPAPCCRGGVVRALRDPVRRCDDLCRRCARDSGRSRPHRWSARAASRDRARGQSRRRDLHRGACRRGRCQPWPRAAPGCRPRLDRRRWL